MKYPLVFVLLTASYIGCKKDDPPAPPADVNDAQTVLLKDITVRSLPNPYFHFEYNDEHFVTRVSFASSLLIYNVEYENGRVKKMTNVPNRNTMIYSYTNNQVSEINEFSGSSGLKLYTYRFSYNSSSQLTQMLWIRFLDNDTGVVFKKAELVYHADGNLATADLYYTKDMTSRELEWSSRDEFDDYDSKTNVDDIGILKDFFDSFLFLPRVKLQKNNPLKEHITGVQNDYDISYTYEYRDSLPVKKMGVVIQTRGGSNKPIDILTQFSYY